MNKANNNSISSIFFDFNQVLKRSAPQTDFAPVQDQLSQQLLQNIFLNQPLIKWAKTHQANFKFYIWSASDPDLLQLIKVLFKPIFTGLISTRATGLQKSEVASYGQIAAQFKLKPAEALLIDDQIENVQTAQRAGFQAIHFVNTADCLRQLDIILA